MPGCSVRTLPFSAHHNVMLTMLVCATRWLFMHLYMLAYLFMHEFCLLVCHPYFNTMKLWTFDPNLHLPSWTPPFVCFLACLPSRLFAFSLVCLLSCFFACHVYHAYLLSCLLDASFMCSFIACLLASSLYLYMYTHEARTHGARARSPKRKQKRRGCEHINISQVAVFSRLGV